MPPHPKPSQIKRTRHYFKEWREFRQLTQEQACERMGWSQPKLSRIENMRQPYTQDDLEEAAHAYQIEQPLDLLRVNPLKEGEVIDLLRLIEQKDQDTVIAILKGLPNRR